MNETELTLTDLVRLAAKNVFTRSAYIDFDKHDIEQHDSLADEIAAEFVLLLDSVVPE